MYDFLTSKRAISFYSGILVSIIGGKILKTEAVRKMTVNTVAKGIMFKDSILEEYANIKDEADDICNEAREVAKNNSNQFSDVHNDEFED